MSDIFTLSSSPILMPVLSSNRINPHISQVWLSLHVEEKIGGELSHFHLAQRKISDAAKK